MAGFFSVKLAPGVRVSASPRGLRTHVGPRGARLHVGGGRTGVSTGAGPFTYYTSVGGSSPRRRPSYAAGPTQAQLNRARKAEQAQLLAAAFEQIESLHRQHFPPAQRPLAPAPPVPPLETLAADSRRAQLRGLPFWRWTARRAAKQRADELAGVRAAELRAQAEATQRAAQAEIDRWWEQLEDNEPDVVLAALAEAFEDNEAPVAPVGVEGAEASLVVLVPGVEGVPERYPTVTDAGNLSLRKMTKSARWETYRQLLAGHALVSVREALAVAPGLQAVSLVVLHEEGADVYGEQRARPVLATRLTRAALHDVRWDEVSAWDVIDQVGEETRLETRGVAREIRPLDLTGEPELARLVEAVDVTELVDA